jgi:hypothetical protein
MALAVGVIGALAAIAYAAPFELWADLVVAAWAGLAAVAFSIVLLVHRDPGAALATMLAGAALLGGAAVVALAIVVPVDRLAVDPFGAPNPWDAWTIGPFALVPLAAATGLEGWVVARPLGRGSAPSPEARAAAMSAVLLSASIATYLVSVLVVQWFQGAVGRAGDPFESATQAQVALSILWVLLGAASFVIGLGRSIAVARRFGLCLLAIAVIKVFMFDLAALDVAYRVLSLLGLGGVLLASSFFANRLRPGRRRGPRERPPSEPAGAVLPDADGV